MDNVWVTSLNQCNKLLKTVPPLKEADYIGNALGMDLSKGEILIYIKYPLKFAKVKFFKPTTLDAHWETHVFFLSNFSKKGCGMTCSSTTETKGLYERVHKAIHGLSKDFIGEKVGIISKRIEMDWNHFMQEAERRVKKII